MKVLMINGSPRANGNTSVSLSKMEKSLQKKVLKQNPFIDTPTIDKNFNWKRKNFKHPKKSA